WLYQAAAPADSLTIVALYTNAMPSSIRQQAAPICSFSMRDFGSVNSESNILIKLQIPTRKLQRSSKSQAQKIQIATMPHGPDRLRYAVWSFSGIWRLEFGVFHLALAIVTGFGIPIFSRSWIAA